MDTILQELQKQERVRENLSALRQRLKDGEDRGRLFSFLAENEALFFGFLACEDAKTRKNAALFFGDLGYGRAAEALYAAYTGEQTLFVKSAYLEALSHMDAAPMAEQLREQLALLQSAPLTPENRKHVTEELRALHKILIQYDGIERHTFDLQQKGLAVLLVTNRNHREVVRRLLPGAKAHPLGVWLVTDDLSSLFQVRAFRELLFPMGERARVPDKPEEAAAALAPWMLNLCRRCHGQEGNFYFRVECRSAQTPEEKGKFCRRLCAQLEEQTKGALVNSPGSYEVELRLVERTEGGFFPCLKFYTLPDRRFAYREHALAVSIHPSEAALMMELARPYLKENARVLDPFCGVGTMLIERDLAVPAREMYAIDTYGEAVLFGRQNAANAGKDIHFIHRDYFDFRHSHRFDEIVTNMPRRGKHAREEIEKLYERFFERSAKILSEDAVIVMYTNEIGFVKKQLRLRRDYRLLQESCMQKKGDFYLLVIERLR